MSFEAPALLLLLLVVPAAIAGYLWLDRRRDARASAWAPVALLPNMIDARRPGGGICPTALLLAGVALLLVGFARPAATFSVKREEATLVVVLDVSGSMAANDTRPSRLAAARAAADGSSMRCRTGIRCRCYLLRPLLGGRAADPRPDAAALRDRPCAVGPAGDSARGGGLPRCRRRRLGACVDAGTPVPARIVLFSDGGQTCRPDDPAAGRCEGGEGPRSGDRGRGRHARRRSSLSR